jgi:hypothetical protein
MCGQSADLFNVTLGGWYTQPVTVVKEGNKKGTNKVRNGKLSIAITDVSIDKVNEFLMQARI